MLIVKSHQIHQTRINFVCVNINLLRWLQSQLELDGDILLENINFMFRYSTWQGKDDIVQPPVCSSKMEGLDLICSASSFDRLDPPLSAHYPHETAFSATPWPTLMCMLPTRVCHMLLAWTSMWKLYWKVRFATNVAPWERNLLLSNKERWTPVRGKGWSPVPQLA